MCRDVLTTWGMGFTGRRAMIRHALGDRPEEAEYDWAPLWKLSAKEIVEMGKTTAEMQIAGTFLEAGWDFVDKTENGMDDIWWILEGQDYPRLWWERGEEGPL